MPDLGKEISLAPSSLYVCLTQLMGPGFHWSLYITDASGVATRYHWREVPGRRGADDPIEEFAYGVIKPVTEITRGNNFNLAFIKISAYVPHEGMQPEYFVALFKGVFTTSYSSVRENRQHQISCRTWLMAALQRMRVAGHLTLDSAAVAGLEASIKEIGNAVEERVSTGIVESEFAYL